MPRPFHSAALHLATPLQTISIGKVLTEGFHLLRQYLTFSPSRLVSQSLAILARNLFGATPAD